VYNFSAYCVEVERIESNPQTSVRKKRRRLRNR
jgi:hypothetical protein